MQQINWIVILIHKHFKMQDLDSCKQSPWKIEFSLEFVFLRS